MATRPVDTLLDGVDLSERVANPTALAATTVPGGGRVRFVVRYLSPNTAAHPQKRLTNVERVALHAAGLPICVVWETGTTRATAGFNAGVVDAHSSAAVLSDLGAPPDMPVHFAIDSDLAGVQVDAYFRGAGSVLGAARVGAYGGVHPLAYLWERGLIRYAWQTFAWSQGALLEQATAYQWRNDVVLAGNNVDLNAALAADYGQWEPGGSAGDRGVTDMTTVDLTPAAIAAIWAYRVDNLAPPADGDPVSAGQAARMDYFRLGYVGNTAIPLLLGDENAAATALAGLQTALAATKAELDTVKSGLDGLPASVAQAVSALITNTDGEATQAEIEEVVANVLGRTSLTVAPPVS